MQTFEETVTFSSVTAVRRTPKSLQCRIGGVLKYVPVSQIDFRSRVRIPGDFGDLITSAWWASVEGINQHGGGGRSEQTYRAESRSSVIELTSATRLYRQLAAKYHPDRSPETAEVMRDLNELWQAVGTDLKEMSVR